MNKAVLKNIGYYALKILGIGVPVVVGAIEAEKEKQYIHDEVEKQVNEALSL